MFVFAIGSAPATNDPFAAFSRSGIISSSRATPARRSSSNNLQQINRIVTKAGFSQVNKINSTSQHPSNLLAERNGTRAVFRVVCRDKFTSIMFTQSRKTLRAAETCVEVSQCRTAETRLWLADVALRGLLPKCARQCNNSSTPKVLPLVHCCGIGMGATVGVHARSWEGSRPCWCEDWRYSNGEAAASGGNNGVNGRRQQCPRSIGECVLTYEMAQF